jgi:hypothetical protein
LFGSAEVRSIKCVWEHLAMSTADSLAGDPYTAPDFMAAALITIDTQRDVPRP